MSHYVVDVESDGPIPGIHSMICFGIIKVTPDLSTTFYGQVAPISELWVPEAAAISGFTRTEHEAFENPFDVMPRAVAFINATNSGGRPILWSDNNGYDWSFMNYYFHAYAGENPFGWSSRRIGDLWCGLMGDSRYKWKKHRKTQHSHHPIDDARGNAEALLEAKARGVKIGFT